MSDTLQAVYDARDASYSALTPPDMQRVDQWAADHGIEPSETYRVEIHLLDCPFARVFAYDLDENGRVWFNPATNDAARRDPYDLPISSMPPVKPATPTPPQETP